MDVPSGELGENIDEKSGLKLGWFKGVYVKCLLNIWGVMFSLVVDLYRPLNVYYHQLQYE